MEEDGIGTEGDIDQLGLDLAAAGSFPSPGISPTKHNTLINSFAPPSPPNDIPG